MLDDACKVQGQEKRVAVKDIAELVVENLAPGEPAAPAGALAEPRGPA